VGVFNILARSWQSQYQSPHLLSTASSAHVGVTGVRAPQGWTRVTFLDPKPTRPGKLFRTLTLDPTRPGTILI